MTAHAIQTALTLNMTGKKQWYEIFPEMLDEEREVLEKRGFSFDVNAFETEKAVIFRGCLSGFPERSIIIEYPRAYPSIAPIVSDDGQCDLLPRHQKASNRVYCLFGPEGKYWRADLTAADALDETERLCRDVLSPEGNESSLPDPNPEPPSAQPIFPASDMVLVPPIISDYLPEDRTQAAKGMMTVRFSDGKSVPNQNHGRGIVLKVKFSGESEEAKCSPVYDGMFRDSGAKEASGIVMFLPKLDRNIYTTQDLIELLKEHGFALQSYPWHAIIFPEESGDRSATRFSWLIFRQLKGQALPVPIQTTTYRASENSVRIPGLEWLPNKRVAIIGCGSIGSKVAAVLAASGIHKFFLIDRDKMEPSNSIRHECGIETYSLDKTTALAKRLVSINPECFEGIHRIQGDPFGKCGSDHFEKMINDLQECDLIINATGNDRIGRYLNQLAYQAQIPCLHASVTYGAWSGEAIRSIPGRTPCWQCWDHAFGDSKPPGEPVANGMVFGPGCDQPTFTGTSYHMGMVANLAAELAVDTLRAVETGVSEFEGDYLLWEVKDTQGHPVLRSSVKEIPARENCQCCG